MLQHIQDRRAEVGGPVQTVGTAAAIGLFYGGMGYGVYLMVKGSVVTGALVFLGAPVAAILLGYAVVGKS